MVRVQHTNSVEAYTLEDDMNTYEEDHDAAHGGIWVDKTVSLNNSSL